MRGLSNLVRIRVMMRDLLNRVEIKFMRLRRIYMSNKMRMNIWMSIMMRGLKIMCRMRTKECSRLLLSRSSRI